MNGDHAGVSSPPHAMAAAQVASSFGVEATTGLTDAEAARRLAESGANQLAPREVPPLWRMAWDAATQPFIVLLLGSGGLALFLGLVGEAPVSALDTGR